MSRHINPDGREIQFSYDQYGQLTQVDDGAWPLTFEYDAAGNLLAEHQGWASSYFKHDAMGRLAHWQLPDGNNLAYHYLHGELSGIDLNGAELTRHQRVGGLEMRRSQGALTQQYEYDEQGRLTALRLQRGKQVARERRYGYDRTGNLLQINDSVQGEQHYRYDPLDRLLEVRGELTERFLHDPAGNQLSQKLCCQYFCEDCLVDATGRLAKKLWASRWRWAAGSGIVLRQLRYPVQLTRGYPESGAGWPV
ncbi:RHS repeat domain-containing protein [Aeromonas veronii]|uniref:RHS repeat domain-containing protein n=1 Tax=Aeromonas veronii TaxID=654 RepID=UPI003D1ACF57